LLLVAIPFFVFPGWSPGFSRLKPGLQPDSWKTITAKDNTFSFQMPGSPKEDRQLIKTATGGVDLGTYLLDLPRSEGTLGVFVNEFPEEGIKALSPEKRLDSARDGAVANVKGKLKSEKKITLQENPGRDVLIEVDSKSIVRVRLYVVKNRLYQVLVSGPKDLATSKTAERFLESFKLTAKIRRCAEANRGEPGI
jgi:hypothetical protein